MDDPVPGVLVHRRQDDIDVTCIGGAGKIALEGRRAERPVFPAVRFWAGELFSAVQLDFSHAR